MQLDRKILSQMALFEIIYLTIILKEIFMAKKPIMRAHNIPI
jgi:hypothetical protein